MGTEDKPCTARICIAINGRSGQVTDAQLTATRTNETNYGVSIDIFDNRIYPSHTFRCQTRKFSLSFDAIRRLNVINYCARMPCIRALGRRKEASGRRSRLQADDKYHFGWRKKAVIVIEIYISITWNWDFASLCSAALSPAR